MRSSGVRACGLCLLFAMLVVPTAAQAKTARNYCHDWSAIGAGSFWPVAGVADDFQKAKGYTVYSFAQFGCTNIFAALQLESIMIAASHASSGCQVYRNNDTWTCVATWTRTTHTHSIGGYKYTCDGTKNIRAISGSDSPCRMVLWMGCNTADDPGTVRDSLREASSLEGMNHNGAFTTRSTWTIGLATTHTGTGSHSPPATTPARRWTTYCACAAVALRLRGGYDSHTYVGSDIKI